MAPSDRELRVHRRSFNSCAKEIDGLLQCKVTSEIYCQMEVLVESSLKPTMERFNDSAFKLYLEVDETVQDDLDLEKKVQKDQAEVRNAFSLLQARIKTAGAALEAEKARLSIGPAGSSTLLDSSKSSSDGPKLRKIEVPEFDGDLSKFYNFKALFSNLVHNSSEFSNVQKMYYLKQSLVGKAKIVLQDCDLADDAYNEAWEYFLERYESKRAIVRNFFVKLSSLQQIKSETGIREMLDNTMAIIRGLKVAGESVNETFSRYIAFLVASKLDAATAKDWENHTCTKRTYPLFDELFKFLQGRSFVIDERLQDKPKEIKESSKQVVPKKSFVALSKPGPGCVMCGGMHFLNQCEKFKAISPHRRFDIVKENRLCLICFSKDHASPSCNAKVKCRCGKPHHYMLHFEFKGSNKEPVAQADGSAAKKDGDGEDKSKKVYASLVSSPNHEDKEILLPSAVVRFSCGDITGTIRVLLDSCSQATLVTDRMIRKFRLPTHTPVQGKSYKGVSAGVVSPNQFARFFLISRTQCFSVEVEAEVVPPSSMDYSAYAELDKEQIDCLSKIPLADPALGKKPVRISDVDMIIGAEYYGKCYCDKSMEVNNLTFKQSKFGWTVLGPVSSKRKDVKFTGFTIKTIEHDLKKFHEAESFAKFENRSSEKVDRCVEHFEKTHQIVADGKFSLRMPFQIDKSKVANNRHMALKSLFRLEQTLDPSLKVEYVRFMREYIAMGHAILAEPTNGPCYFIPHRAVIREDSLTTPLRVVFNASSKVKGAVSLNEALMIGPQIQRELFDILISVRSYRYVFSADIEKMYRMVWIDEQDQDMQRILWRESSEDPIREYRLRTVTYGTGPASFMATQCLEMIARNIEKEQPEAARIIRENFYMDDLLAGGDDLDEVCINRKVIHNALLDRGFRLRKYCANSKKIVSDIPNELLVNGTNVELAENIALLGVVWSPGSDDFCVKLNFRDDEPNVAPTKRLMMSYLARTFDPLGLVAPVTLRGKLMIQRLWREGLDWDQPVPDDVAQWFVEYLTDIRRLTEFAIPRYTRFPGSKTQIVGFCDASVKAYCALLYVRSIVDGIVRSCKLVCAKTRVAPTKELTIPKMELNSAKLLAELTDRVRKNLNVDLVDCFLFTDATIVLCWLSQPPDEWKKFVSHRVETIQSLIPYDHWYYVTTRANPADLATRGLLVGEFLESPDWITGPSFLKNLEICSNPIPNIDVSQALEKRKKKLVSSKVVLHDNFLDRFSSFTRILRVLAYVLRFVDRTRKRAGSRKVALSGEELDKALRSREAALSVEELDKSLLVAIRIVQAFYFFDDFNRLSNSRALKASSRLLSLAPFLDDKVVMRVGGRLKHARLSESRKHAILLPAKAHFTRVMLRWVHEKYFHAGRKFLLGYLSSRYWIVGGCSNLVKAVVRNCVQCVRYKGETASQMMGQLPPFRVNVSRPFSHTGVDLAGPFECKCVAHRTTRQYKIYVAIFVCMTVKCVHIEVVTDLSTPKFLEALQRFIARRGVPSHMYSDNGTNFQGTRNLIAFNQSQIEDFAAGEGIVWSMIPPRSPHFGGLWESAVRSAKYHLVRVNDRNALAYDEYCTLFARIESVLNSRPLCLTVNQGEDVITPGHFLIGQSLNSPPELEVDGSKSLSRRLFELNHRLKSFWNSWKSDYLNQLQHRYKWQREVPNVKVGQIVLIKDIDDLPPCQWPLGVVEKIYPGSDGIVRVVDVKVSNRSKDCNSSKIFKRSIVNLVKLPIDLHVDDVCDVDVATPEPRPGSAGGVCS